MKEGIGIRCIFLYNPNSGKGKLVNRTSYIEKRLKTRYEEVTIYPTSSREDLINTASKACDEYDAIIFSGGDGTFNNVVSAVSKKERRPILGYIPSGTVNDIARNLKIPYNLDQALKIILEQNYEEHDVGVVNNQDYFMYVVGAGIFTAVSYRTKQKVKRRFGKIAYGIDGIKEVFAVPNIHAKVTTETEEVEQNCSLLLIMNSRSVGGFKFNKKGHLNDGYFDILFVKRKYFNIYWIVKLFLLGIRKKKETTYYKLIRGKKIDVQVDDNYTWVVDGEEGPKGNITIENLHSHIKIFVSKH